ncbi:hypothetical protein ACFWBR_03970 [Streptomyces sp. NPDC060006]|uniref:hypothetical protein n=1 Tax=unclassified Streptomyces TaxID=2593676 RepID=UPI0036416774
MTDAYRVAAGALGLDTPDADAGLQDVLEAGVQQVHKHWRYQWEAWSTLHRRALTETGSTASLEAALPGI